MGTPRNVGRRPGSLLGHDSLQQLGVRQTILTAREPHELPAVERIMALHGYQPHEVVSRKAGDKVTYCRERGISLLLEDRDKTIRLAHEAGLAVLSLRYPYNASVLDTLGIPWGHSWVELRPLIHAALGFSA